MDQPVVPPRPNEGFRLVTDRKPTTTTVTSTSRPLDQVNDGFRLNDGRKSANCSVCGDRAFYVFYGALACDSCRTFFRRQVLQGKTLSCHFKNNCDIQLNTRKDCAKCRLDKCLRVGMKQNLVAVNEVDTTTTNSSASNTTSSSSSSSVSNSSGLSSTANVPLPPPPQQHVKSRKGQERLTPPMPVSYRAGSPSLVPPSTSPLYMGQYRHSLPAAMLSPTGSSSSSSSTSAGVSSESPVNDEVQARRCNVHEFAAQPSVDALLIARHANDHWKGVGSSSLPGDNIKSENGYQEKVGKRTQQQQQRHNATAMLRYRKTPGTPYRLVHPSMGTISIESLNAKEKGKVYEVEMAMEVLREPCADIDLNDARPLHDFLNLIYMATSKLIKATRQYSLLMELPTSDQMHLLKGAVSEMLFLWSVFSLDWERKCWLLPCIEPKSEDTKVQTLSIDVLKAANDNLELYTKYESFVDSFENKFRKDHFLMNLLFVICLFNAERDGLIEKDMIRYERRLYSSLFRRYLIAAYGEPEASSAYTTLIAKLEELSTLKQLYERTSVDIEDVNLLVHPTNSLLIN